MIEIDEREYKRLLQCERDFETVREIMVPILCSMYDFTNKTMAIEKDAPTPTSVLVNFDYENAGALMVALTVEKSGRHWQ